jgi:hypothetical protein
MTAVLDIRPMEPEHYGVQVEEGDVITSHRVTLPAALLDDLAMSDVDPVLVVEESIRFLLDREPATSILDEFSVEDIPRHFPDFYDELRARIS